MKDANRNQHPISRQFLDFNLNFRAILMAYFLGTGGQDVGRSMSILGVGGGISFERSFYRHAPKIGTSIIKICDTIITEA